MTPQEQQMIDGLISRIRSTAVENKDAQAEQHIQQSLSGYPDALYVLVQTVLVQQYGLQQAQSQIGELKQQVQTLQNQAHDQPKNSSGSFLSHISGGGSNPSQPTQGQAPQCQPVNNPGYNSQGSGYPPPPPAYPPLGYPAQGGGLFGGGGGMFGGGGGGFLQGAMQTAAGVAAGEMVFRGMEDLFHGFGGGGERGFTGGGGSGETVVNNYYDDDRSGDRDSGDRGGNDSGFYNPSDDASRNDTTQNFSDSGGDNFSDSGSDDLSLDDSSSDAGGFDDGGSDDFSTDNS